VEEERANQIDIWTEWKTEIVTIDYKKKKERNEESKNKDKHNNNKITK
jgi:hypothetical protein